MNDFLLLKIITKGSSKVVSIVKLSHDMFSWCPGHFYFLKTHFVKFDETQDPFLELYGKYTGIHHMKDRFSGIKMGLLRTFW